MRIARWPPLMLLVACGGATFSADSDGDGLDDAREAALGTDPQSPDTDKDGQSDGDEVLRYKTDPKNMDTDNDGAFDGVEIAQLGTDPNVFNTGFRPTVPMPAAPTIPFRSPRQKVHLILKPDEPLPEDYRCATKGAKSSCFVYIPGGTYRMGAQSTDPAGPNYDPDARPDEGPVHEVTVAPFWIQKFEAQASQWDLCVQNMWCLADDIMNSGGFANAGTDRSNHPANGVTFQGAVNGCEILGARLPTEVEWEFAARGTDGRRWPWGNVGQCGVMPEVNNDGTGFELVDDRPQATCENEGTAGIGRLRGLSPFGLLGMAGNVWEWTNDWYAADTYARHDPKNPHGPDEGTSRVQRGGGWTSPDPSELRTTLRAAMRVDQKVPDVGFRCVRDVLGDAP